MCPQTLILWAIATAGLTSIMVSGYLLQPLRAALSRKWPKSIGYAASCYQCTGTYCGAACAMLTFADSVAAQVVLLAFAGSLVAQVFAASMNAIELMGKRDA